MKWWTLTGVAFCVAFFLLFSIKITVLCFSVSQWLGLFVFAVWFGLIYGTFAWLGARDDK